MGELDNIAILYNTLSKDYSLGSYDDFRSKMQDPTNRKAFYEQVGGDYNLGKTYEDFEKRVIKKKEEPVSSEKPSQKVEEPVSSPKETPLVDPDLAFQGEYQRPYETTTPESQFQLRGGEPLGTGVAPQFQPGGFIERPAQEEAITQRIAEEEIKESVGRPWKVGYSNMINAFADAAVLTDFVGVQPSPMQSPSMQQGKWLTSEESKEFMEQRKNALEDPVLGKFLSEIVRKGDVKLTADDLPTGELAAPAEKWHEYITNPRRLYMGLAHNLPLMGAFVGAAAASGGVSTALMMGVEGGQANAAINQWNKENPDQKVDADERAMIVAGVGAVNGLLERTGIGAIMGRIPGAKGKIAKWLVASGVEGATEALQELNQILGEDVYNQVDEKDWMRLWEAGSAGLVLGFMGGGVTAMNQQVRDIMKERDAKEKVKQEENERIKKRLGNVYGDKPFVSGTYLDEVMSEVPVDYSEQGRSDMAEAIVKKDELTDKAEKASENVKPAFEKQIKEVDKKMSDVVAKEEGLVEEPETLKKPAEKPVEAPKPPEKPKVPPKEEKPLKRPPAEQEMEVKKEGVTPKEVKVGEAVLEGEDLAAYNELVDKYGKEKADEMIVPLLGEAPQAEPSVDIAAKEADKRILEEQKAKEDAIQEQEAEELPTVEEAEPVQEVEEKVRDEGQKILEEEIKKTRKEKLTEKEEEVKSRIAERLGKLGGAKFAVGEVSPDIAKEVAGLVKDLGELGLIQVEKGIDHVVTELKKYLPNVDEADIRKYVEQPKVYGVKKETIPEERLEDHVSKTEAEMIQEGRTARETGEVDAEVLATALNIRPRTTSDVENMAMLDYRRELGGQWNKVYDELEVAREKGDTDAIGIAETNLEAVESKQQSLEKAILESGTELGRSLYSKQLMVDEYGLQTQIRKYERENKGKIPKEIQQKFEEYDRQLKKLNKQIQDYEERGKAATAEAALKEPPRRPRKQKIKPKGSFKSAFTKGAEGADAWLKDVDDQLKKFGQETLGVNLPVAVAQIGIKAARTAVKAGKALSEVVDAAVNAVRNSDWYKNASAEDKAQAEGRMRGMFAGKGEVGAPYMLNDKLRVPNDLIRQYVEEGVDNIGDLVKAIKEDYDIDASERDVRDAVTGYGREQRMTGKDISKKIQSMKRLGRLISQLEDLEKGKRPVKRKVERAKPTEQEIKLRQRIKALRQRLFPEDYQISDEIRLERLKKRLKTQTEDYQKRIKEKDFKPKEKREPVKMDDEALRLQMERNRVKLKFDTEVERAKNKNRTGRQKVVDTLIDLVNLPKALLATADFSAPLRQGAVLLFSHPKAGIKAFGEMFAHAFNPEIADLWLEELQASDEYVLMRQSKLYLAEPTARLSAKEEQFMSNIAHKIPFYRHIVGASERAYVGYLNKIRSDVFIQGSAYLKSQGHTFQNNPKAFKAWADFINNATGRGKLGMLESSASVLNGLMFAPRLVASRFNLLNPVKYLKMPKHVRKMATRDMMSFVGVSMSVLALASLAGADVEWDPRSSDFLKIRIGNLRMDIFAGFQQPMRALSQFASGRTKSTTTGVVSKIDPKEFPYKNRWSVLGRFVRGKLSPTPSLIHDIVAGQTMMGKKLKWKDLPEDIRVTFKGLTFQGWEKEPTTLKRGTIEMFAPLYLQDVVDVWKEEGIGRTALAATTAMFGVGVQHYGERNPARKAVSQGLTLDDAYEFRRLDEEDGELSDRQKSSIEKEFGVYDKYGLDNEDVNFLMSKGITNDEKAAYVVETGLDDETINNYYRDDIISVDLSYKIDDLKKKK
jgi:hypothetical protein